MKNITILWVDDEIELLLPHVMFLNDRGYEVLTCSNGADALVRLENTEPDIILLDENMPGISGLETLTRIKTLKPSIPVVMITKSEEENLMEDAIGSKIADYLIKPVNPKQILLSIKKNTEQKKLVSERTTTAYQSDFLNITNLINNARTYDDWVEVYQKLVFWELELEKINDSGMFDILQSQHLEANQNFSKFVRKNYLEWFRGNGDKPLLSPAVVKEKVAPYLSKGEKVFFIVIDNLRLDQWKTLYPAISDFLKIEKEEVYCSILPTVTQYARNALFAGLMPLGIRKLYPNLWEGNDEDEINNQYEEDLMRMQLSRLGLDTRFVYEKINNQKTGLRVLDNVSNYADNQLVVLVYNFVDILSHARTEVETVRELATDEAAYRTLTLSWFKHSYLYELLKAISSTKCKIIITTDHGSVKVSNPIKVVGDRTTTVNLRYKQGKNLGYNAREVFEIKDPQLAQLPRFNLSTSYIFANSADFMAYPNNYNHYVSYYKNTFQHGGISLEEMIVPLAVLSSAGG
ncbi:MAG: bifunctional response regulator/alkaline phosphatase family protein [Bacteroidota bacterium]|nr:bifunctional response regulator/alkaline phosphatase family protein [Bacteroidota bacterium]